MCRKSQAAVLAALALCAGTKLAGAYPISLTLLTSNGIFMDAGMTTPLPAGAYFQILWSADAVYGSIGDFYGVGNVADAQMGANGTTPTSFGDYVIFTGYTTIDGGFSDPLPTGVLNNNAVNGNTISSGYVYGLVYQDATPNVGDAWGRTAIYGPPNPTWGDAGAALPPPPDSIDFSPAGGLIMVPEPGTLVLGAVGLLTLAARRRRA